MQYFRFYLISILIIILDQATKLLVHFNMELGYSGQIAVLGDWFKLYYVLNPGIAFGINFESEYSKFLLTLFRIFASVGIGYYLFLKIKEKAHPGFLVCLALILAGAVGNVVDSIFYGVFLENNAIDGAFTPWFHGQVIDMLYFPLIEGVIPDWVPGWGGDPFLFFSAIFNVADSSIFIGVVTIMIFQKTFLPKKDEEDDDEKKEDDTETDENFLEEESSLEEDKKEEPLNPEK
ncbi:MAG: lipoprotein signal peptidase [Thalassobius sp.]|nr:lipoprotein signal peptidase [Thalassovita sp.]